MYLFFVAVVQMARVHMDNRRKYALAAARAHQKGDSNAAKQFSDLAQREERLQKLWQSRMSQKAVKVDLHGLFVKEALEVVSQMMSSMVVGESVQVLSSVCLFGCFDFY
jgi:rubrerythrin